MSQTSVEKKMNRRDFMKVNIRSLFKTAAAFVNEQMDTHREYIRPPGALEEPSFLLACSRCGACEYACPEGIISLLGPASGKNMGTPVLDLEKSPCTMCMKCVLVCNDKALELTPDKPVRIGVAEIVKKNCLAERQTICDYCSRACPYPGTLYFKEGHLQINADLCTGCGMCATSCIAEYKAIYVRPV